MSDAASVIARLLLGAARRVSAETEMLSKLDSAIGDGDHGTTMKRIADAIAKSVQDAQAADARSLLATVGSAVMSVDGGSASPLMGSFLLGMSEASGASDGDLTASALTEMFEAGVARLREQTPAAEGDKTMLDALCPAVAAMRRGVEAGQDVSGSLRSAAEAAQAGAVRTRDMQAKFGRARNLGARSVGHQDPGAVSISLFFRGMADSLA